MSLLYTSSAIQQIQPLLIKVLKGEKSKEVPLWLMRQAGRYLPEYRALREKHPFWKLLLTPNLASEVTLQPIKRFGFDAAILFSDILVIPYALGQEVVFEKGVHLGHIPAFFPLENKNIVDKLSPVFETVRLTRQALPSEKALIGFAGCPWTVLCYMLGGTSKENFFPSR